MLVCSSQMESRNNLAYDIYYWILLQHLPSLFVTPLLGEKKKEAALSYLKKKMCVLGDGGGGV